MGIEKIFTNLKNWSDLPSYQLERRLDIFFSIYLEEIISIKFPLEKIIKADGALVGIVPELPIIRGNIGHQESMNRSFKVDYAIFCESGKVFLVELKTDNSSTRDNQFDYYLESIKEGLEAILDGIRILQSKTAPKTRRKYEHLNNELLKIGVWNEDNQIDPKFYFHEKPILIIPNKDNKYVDKTEQIDFDEIRSVLNGYDDEVSIQFSTFLSAN